MPHDKNGELLKVGDHVVVECEVVEVYAATDFCNVQLQFVEPMYPSDRRDRVTLNAKQVTKVQADDVLRSTQPAELARS